MQTQWKLESTLRFYKKTPLALAKASGLAKTTVYNIVNQKAKAIEIATLDKLLAGLEQLVGQPMQLSDILERQAKPNALLEDILRRAKPFDWEAVNKLLPAWTPEEQLENEAFLQAIEKARKADRTSSAARETELLALFTDHAQGQT